MRAVVLVGGFGTRLRPLTLSTPKQMLPILDVPMIERVLGHLAESGIDDAVLSMGYRPDAFIDAYPANRCAGVALHYAVEPEPLDTAGAIAFAAADAGIDETFVVVNGDVLTDLDVDALVAFHRERGAEGTIHLTKVDDPSAFGVVPTDADGRVIAFVEKPPRDEAPTDLINAGTYVLEPSVLARIPSGRKVSIERETFPAMVADRTLFAMATADYWIDAGTPSQYLQAHLDLLDGRRPGVPVAGVADGAAVGDAAYVAGDAVIERSVVGAGARVESGARVIDSVLLPGAVVGPGTVVRRSIVGEGAVVGSGARLDDLTVVGSREHVADGAELAGARVPEDPAPR